MQIQLSYESHHQLKHFVRLMKRRVKNPNSKLAPQGLLLLTLGFWKNVIKAGPVQGSHQIYGQKLKYLSTLPVSLLHCQWPPEWKTWVWEGWGLGGGEEGWQWGRGWGEGLWVFTGTPQPREWEDSLAQGAWTPLFPLEGTALQLNWKVKEWGKKTWPPTSIFPALYVPRRVALNEHFLSQFW